MVESSPSSIGESSHTHRSPSLRASRMVSLVGCPIALNTSAAERVVFSSITAAGDDSAQLQGTISVFIFVYLAK